MRQISLLVAALMVASVMALLGVPPPQPPQPVPPTPAAATDLRGLFQHFADSVMRRDFTAIDRVLSNDVTIKINGIPQNKTQFVDSIRNDQVASELIQMADYTESYGLGVFNVLRAVMFNADSPLANYTGILPKSVMSGSATADGAAIGYFQQFIPNFEQSNASAMMATFNALVNASNNRDITAWTKLTNNNSTFALWPAYSKDPPMVFNQTSFLAILADSFAKDSSLTNIVVVNAFPAGDLVAAEVVTFVVQDEHRVANKLFRGIRLNPDMTVKVIDEFPLFGF